MLACVRMDQRESRRDRDSIPGNVYRPLIDIATVISRAHLITPRRMIQTLPNPYEVISHLVFYGLFFW